MVAVVSGADEVDVKEVVELVAAGVVVEVMSGVVEVDMTEVVELVAAGVSVEIFELVTVVIFELVAVSVVVGMVVELLACVVFLVDGIFEVVTGIVLVETVSLVVGIFGLVDFSELDSVIVELLVDGIVGTVDMGVLNCAQLMGSVGYSHPFCLQMP